MIFMAKLTNWSFAALLTLPILAFFLFNLYNHDQGLVSTGFIQYDNVTYAANAYQYNWAEHNSLFYTNRLNDSHNYSNIYFNPQVFVLALLMRAGVSPGYAVMMFTLICAFVFFRIIIALYDSVKANDEYRTRNILLLAWGGGLLCAAGLFLNAFRMTNHDFWSSLFTLDPAHGWWGLNLGRSLFFSLEAWYHLLFFATILGLVKRKWILAVFLLCILSLSHPFTGIELLLILLTWTVAEKFLIKKIQVPNYFLVSVLIVLGFHLWYYLVFLNRYPEHFSVFEQYSLNWRYRFYHFIPAYCLAAALVILAASIPGWKKYVSNSNTRLFLMWAVAAFALANHELFIKPMQPLHFTRGYIWSAMMLAGLPALNAIWKFFSEQGAGALFALLFSILFLSDNLLWICANSRRVHEPTGVTLITDEQEAILSGIEKVATYNDLIIGTDEVIPYLSSVRTKSNIWMSHPYNTPFYTKKQLVFLSFIQTGILPIEWKDRRLIFIVEKDAPSQVAIFKKLSSKLKPLAESSNYLVYLMVQQ
jgi:hypothetical protein